MIPGYRPFFETSPPAIVAKVARVETEMSEKATNTSNNSNPSKGYRSENTRDGESIVERSSIQEFDGNLPRDAANMAASAAYDRNRQRYETSNPGRDPRHVENLYRDYIQRWAPGSKDDLPATPPNTRGNAELWRAWWKIVEQHNLGKTEGA